MDNMINLNEKKMGICLIIMGLLFIIIPIIIMISQKPNKQVEENKSLNESEMIALLKYASFDLNKSEELKDGSITDTSMVSFALSYMQISDKYKQYVYHDEQDDVIIGKKTKVEEVVKYIFNRTVDFKNVECDIIDENIYISRFYHGGDMQVYKFKSEEYDDLSNTYTLYIDVLETGFNRLVELTDPSIIDYDESDVILTMIFKYRIIDGRKVLLAFNTISNW